MDFLLVEPSFQPLLEQSGLCGCAQIVRFFTQTENVPVKRTWLRAAQLGSGGDATPVFYKQYAFARPSWRFLWRASKARRESENYSVFQRLNIPSAQCIACGEERDWLGRLKRAFIITRAIPNAATLLDFIPAHCPNRATASSRRMRRRIVEQLAGMTRRIHEAGFFHNDLYWRNILVQQDSTGEPKLWWIDCPRGKFSRIGFLAHHRRFKDLAALDKSAEQFFSVGERLHFVRVYLGRKRFDASARRLIRDTLAYRKKRWRK